MDIYYVAHQPGTSDGTALVCNYRQIFYNILADSAVPPTQPMYCDVYVLGVFYKTLSSYSIVTDSVSGYNYFTFDIQDALQEYIDTFIALQPISVNLVNSSDQNSTQLGLVQCFFRGSTIVAGILVPNGPVPIQGTSTTAPVSGSLANSSLRYYVLNASILPGFETVYSNALEIALELKQITYSSGLPGTRIYPLSNLPSTSYDAITFYRLPLSPPVYAQDDGQFPFIILEFGVSGSLSRQYRNCQLVLLYYSLDQSTFVWDGSQVLTPTTSLISAGYTYYIPVGLADIQACPGMTPTLFAGITDPTNTVFYNVALWDVDSGTYAFISPSFAAANTAAERVRLWFQNMYGNFEQITFIRASENFITQSSTYFTPYTESYNDSNLTNSALTKGLKRYNVRGSDELTLSVIVDERSLEWLKELLMSPYILQQFNGLVPFPKSPGFRGVRILDGTFITLKSIKDGNKIYEVVIKVMPMIDRIQLRN